MVIIFTQFCFDDDGIDVYHSHQHHPTALIEQNHSK